MRGQLFVISAPSGAGKTSLAGPLVGRVERLVFSVSWTTRRPRTGERDGVEYHFTDEENFRRRISEGAFLEWAEVHGRLYGTARDETLAVLESGRDVLLDIDVQGAQQVRRSGFPASLVFIMPPDFATLRERLARRGTESEEELARRLDNASAEMRAYLDFDYVVVNDDLQQAARELESIVLAERTRRERQAERLAAIVETFPEPRER